MAKSRLQDAKAQVASMDMVISALVLILLLALILVLISNITDKQKSRVIYGGGVFENIENLNPTFLKDYRVDEAELATFASNYVTMKDKTLIGSDVFDPKKNEICIFFLDGNTPMDFNSLPANGHASCQVANPCKGFDQAFIFAKPVVRDHKVVTMYIAVCE